MPRHIQGRGVWFLLLVLTGVPPVVIAQNATGGRKGGSENEVTVTPSASKPDASGNQVIVLNLDINKGWHIYANPVENEKLKDGATQVTVTGSRMPTAVKIDYPPGTLHTDSYFGKYKVYEGRAMIRAQVQRAPGDNGPLTVKVRVSACDANRCLLPAEIPITVP